MLNGNMCIGVYKEYLITRIGTDAFEKVAGDPHVHPMDITGKPMKGWAKIGQAGINSDADLQRHIDLAIPLLKRCPRNKYSFFN